MASFLDRDSLSSSRLTALKTLEENFPNTSYCLLEADLAGFYSLKVPNKSSGRQVKIKIFVFPTGEINWLSIARDSDFEKWCFFAGKENETNESCHNHMSCRGFRSEYQTTSLLEEVCSRLMERKRAREQEAETRRKKQKSEPIEINVWPEFTNPQFSASNFVHIDKVEQKVAFMRSTLVGHAGSSKILPFLGNLKEITSPSVLFSEFTELDFNVVSKNSISLVPLENDIQTLNLGKIHSNIEMIPCPFDDFAIIEYSLASSPNEKITKLVETELIGYSFNPIVLQTKSDTGFPEQISSKNCFLVQYQELGRNQPFFVLEDFLQFLSNRFGAFGLTFSILKFDNFENITELEVFQPYFANIDKSFTPLTVSLPYTHKRFSKFVFELVKKGGRISAIGNYHEIKDEEIYKIEGVSDRFLKELLDLVALE